jgi:hypothetical protein
MVLLCGIPTETPLALVREQLDALGTPTVVFNQRRFATTEVCFDVSRNTIAGFLRTEGKTHRLEDFSGVYTRLMDDRYLPELENIPIDSEVRRHVGPFTPR